LAARRLLRYGVGHSHGSGTKLFVVAVLLANTLPAFAQNGTHFDPDVVDAFVRIAPSLATVGR